MPFQYAVHTCVFLVCSARGHEQLLVKYMKTNSARDQITLKHHSLIKLQALTL